MKTKLFQNNETETTTTSPIRSLIRVNESDMADRYELQQHLTSPHLQKCTPKALNLLVQLLESNKEDIMAEEENQESSSPNTQFKLCCHCHLRQSLPFKETICSTCSDQIKAEDQDTCLVKLEDLSEQSQGLEEQETVCQQEELIQEDQYQQESEPEDDRQIELRALSREMFPNRSFLKRSQLLQHLLSPLNHLLSKLKEGKEPLSFHTSLCKRLTECLEQELVPVKRQRPVINTTKCFSCCRRTGLLGNICNHCSLNYCRAHRLPESHDCESDYKNEGRKRLRTRLLSGSIEVKHKGKMPGI